MKQDSSPSGDELVWGKGAYSVLETFKGCKQYMVYGNRKADIARVICWAAQLSLMEHSNPPYSKQMTAAERDYAKGELDRAYQSAFGHRGRKKKSARGNV